MNLFTQNTIFKRNISESREAFQMNSNILISICHVKKLTAETQYKPPVYTQSAQCSQFNADCVFITHHVCMGTPEQT